MALDLSSLFSPPTETPQQGMPQGLLSSLFGGGGGTAGNPAMQQMQQGMGMLNAGQPYQLPSPPMQHPMMGMGGGGMRQMGMQQPGMMPGGAGMGTATGNPFLAALLQRLQQGQPQQPQQPTLPQGQGMSPSPFSFNLMGSGY